MQITYQLRGRKHGPIDSEQFCLLVIKGKIPRTTLVCFEGTENWVSTEDFLTRQGVESSPPTFPEPQEAASDSNALKWVGSAILTLFLLVLGFIWLMQLLNRGPSREEFATQAQAYLETSFNQDPAALALFQQTHIGAEFKGVTIKRVDCITFNNEEYLGSDLRNLNELKIRLIWHWKGPFIEKGYTEMVFIQDAQTGIFKKREFIASNSTINLMEEFDKVEWKDLAIGLALRAAGVK